MKSYAYDLPIEGLPDGTLDRIANSPALRGIEAFLKRGLPQNPFDR
jgi:hypothetical protein